MRIKRFVGRNSQETLRKVKEELGPGAVILGSRNLSKDEASGAGSFFEITAAADPEARTAQRNGNRTVGDSQPTQRQWQSLEQELREMKEILWNTEAASSLGAKTLFNAQLQGLYAACREMGIRGSLIRPILNEYHSRCPSKETMDSRVDSLKQALSQLLAGVKTVPLSVDGGHQLIWSFVGPTGVGKTTTMAKLAARRALELGKRVALITVDQYRIGAIDQMCSYARIMKLPFETAANSKQLGQAINRHSDKEVLFIDTAGRSPSRSSDLTELAEIFQVPWKIEHQLVLSATTRYRDLMRAATAFQPLAYSNYLFTKLDETSDGAALVNFLLSRPLALSYFTTGQRVPEDIEPASKKRLATLLLQRMSRSRYPGDGPHERLSTS